MDHYQKDGNQESGKESNTRGFFWVVLFDTYTGGLT